MTIPFVDLFTKAKARLLGLATPKENVSPVAADSKAQRGASEQNCFTELDPTTSGN